MMFDEIVNAEEYIVSDEQENDLKEALYVCNEGGLWPDWCTTVSYEQFVFIIKLFLFVGNNGVPEEFRM